MVLDGSPPINAPCEELSCAKAGRSCVECASTPESPLLRAEMSSGGMSGGRSQQRWVKMDG